MAVIIDGIKYMYFTIPFTLPLIVIPKFAIKGKKGETLCHVMFIGFPCYCTE